MCFSLNRTSRPLISGADDGSRAASGARVVGGDPSHSGTLLLALRDVKTIFINLRALGDATANCSGWQPGAGRRASRRLAYGERAVWWRI